MTRAPRISPRKKPTQERAHATVEAILDATARILKRDGYDHASTNRIAQEAGVSVGSLYQYFPNKDSLVAGLVDRHSAEMLEVFTRTMAAVEHESIPTAARAIVRGMVAAHGVDPKLHSVLMQEVPRLGAAKRKAEELQRHTGGILRAHLEARAETLRPKDLDLAVFVLVHTVEALTHAAVLERPDFLGDQLADEIADVVIRYLVP